MTRRPSITARSRGYGGGGKAAENVGSCRRARGQSADHVWRSRGSPTAGRLRTWRDCAAWARTPLEGAPRLHARVARCPREAPPRRRARRPGRT